MTEVGNHRLEPAVRPGRLRRFVLHLVTVLLLGWVSYGSHEVLVWIGMPWWPAWIYPAVVDFALLYVTPFAVDADLPDDGRWPMRSDAKRIRRLVLPMVALFNVLHMVLFVQDHPPHFANQLVTAVGTWIAYVIAVTAGWTPVWLYARVVNLEIMHAAWEVSANREAREAAARRAEEKAEEARRAEQAAIAQRERIEAETERELKLIEAQTALAEKRAEAARVRRESTRAARVDQRADSRAEGRVDSRADTPTPTREEQPVSSGDPGVDALLATMPAGKKSDQVTWLLAEAWKADIELKATHAARLIGADGSTGRNAGIKLRESGVLPPSERPKLTLARS